MPLFGPVWKKFGDQRARECIPQWRFEGKGLFTQFFIKQRWASNTLQLFKKINGGSTGLHGWLQDGEVPFARCTSTMTLIKVNLVAIENTFDSPFEIALWRDEFTEVRKLFELGIGEGGNREINVRETLAFDSDYALSFRITNGIVPPINSPSHIFSGIISMRMDMGAGDP